MRKKRPDKAKALSVVKAAEGNIEVIESLETNQKAGHLIISTIYESFRMLGDALLTSEGFETTGKDHHSEMVGRLLKLEIKANRSLIVLDELRKKRNKINYEGYSPSKEEVVDAIAIKEALWKPVLGEVKRLVDK